MSTVRRTFATMMRYVLVLAGVCVAAVSLSACTGNAEDQGINLVYNGQDIVLSKKVQSYDNKVSDDWINLNFKAHESAGMMALQRSSNRVNDQKTNNLAKIYLKGEPHPGGKVDGETFTLVPTVHDPGQMTLHLAGAPNGLPDHLKAQSGTVTIKQLQYNGKKNVDFLKEGDSDVHVQALEYSFKGNFVSKSDPDAKTYKISGTVSYNTP